MNFAPTGCVVSSVDPRAETSEVRFVLLDHAHTGPNNRIG